MRFTKTHKWILFTAILALGLFSLTPSFAATDSTKAAQLNGPGIFTTITAANLTIGTTTLDLTGATIEVNAGAITITGTTHDSAATTFMATNTGPENFTSTQQNIELTFIGTTGTARITFTARITPDDLGLQLGMTDGTNTAGATATLTSTKATARNGTSAVSATVTTGLTIATAGASCGTQ